MNEIDEIKNQKTYTIPQIASMLHVDVRTVYRYLENGLIGFFKISERRTIVTESSLNNFLENCKKNSQ
jgi:excisionase family DNA binding protein